MELSSRLNRSMWLDNGSVRQTLWTMVELLILINPFERTQVAPNTLYALYLLSGLDHCFLVIDAVSMPLIDALLSEAVCLGCSNYLIDKLLVLPLTSVGSRQSCLLPSFTLRFPKVSGHGSLSSKDVALTIYVHLIPLATLSPCLSFSLQHTSTQVLADNDATLIIQSDHSLRASDSNGTVEVEGKIHTPTQASKCTDYLCSFNLSPMAQPDELQPVHITLPEETFSTKSVKRANGQGYRHQLTT